MIDKSIAITGADGFIGSHLTQYLCERYKFVKVLVCYNSFGSWGWLDSIEKPANLEVVLGDIRDSYFVNNFIKGADIVFHLAALIGIPYSYVAPQSYIATNVMGTMHVLEACKLHGVERLLVTSTSEVYGSAQYVPIDEDHPIVAQSPYAASKVGADSLAISYFKSFALPITIVRPFNTYGPRQSARAIIPTIIGQVAAGVKSIQLGSLSPTRDLTFVMDTCQGFFEIAENAELIGQTVNIGSNFEISMSDLVYKILKLMNALDVKIEHDESRVRPVASEVDRLFADTSKLRKITNFECKFDLDQGLLKTISFFKDPQNLARYKMNGYNI